MFRKMFIDNERYHFSIEKVDSAYCVLVYDTLRQVQVDAQYAIHYLSDANSILHNMVKKWGGYRELPQQQEKAK